MVLLLGKKDPYETGRDAKIQPKGQMVHVSVRHIFISLTSFMGIPNSMRILYKTPFLTES